MLWVLALQSAFAGDGGWAAAPLGIGLFVHERPVRGTIYAATQAAGVAGIILGSLDSADAYLDTDSARLDRDHLITAVSVATAAASFAISLIDGSKVHETDCVQAEAQRKGLALWDEAVAMRAAQP